MDDTKSFQGYVNQSLMDAGKHNDKDYLKIMTGLFKEGNLNLEQVFMFMRTLVRNAEKDGVRNYLDVNEDIASNVQDTMDYGFITEDGEYTDLCVDKMIELGFEKTQGESSVKDKV
tara:strand:+ start:251 stop:598 length:348 start_codon:yes stop_codon:yes gene_type:complete